MYHQYTDPNSGPTYTEKLHDSTSAALAVFIGGPVAGGVILMSNFNAMGDKRHGSLSLVLSLGYTAFLVAVVIALMNNPLAGLFNIATLLLNVGAYYHLNERWFGTELEKRKRTDHTGIQPVWLSAVIGIACAALLFFTGVVIGFVGRAYGLL